MKCHEIPYEAQQAFNLAKTIGSRRHKALIALLIKERKAAGMNQTELARALGQYQSFIARVESGERRVDVIEFLDIAAAIGIDPKAAISKLQAKWRPKYLRE